MDIERELTLGSLFDGIGGFCYAACLTGRIRPVWAAEIEPNCINITRSHFPQVMHVGSVTGLKGDEIQPVDIITFGSPCQDLSIAGRRKGLKGSRSGLFMEAVRIIEEMRSATNGRYPAFIIWENVPGAFSSGGGADFRAVLEKITKASIPMPPSGRWADAGMVRGAGVDTAWRVLDGQPWGTPQRRKRIYLVGDLRGQRAAEILFKPESLLGYTPQGREQKQATAGQFADSVRTENSRAGEIIGLDFAHADSVVRIFAGKAPTLVQNMGRGGGQVPCVMYEEKRNVIPVRGEAQGNKKSNGLGVGKAGEPCQTLTASEIHGVFYEACQRGSSAPDRPESVGDILKRKMQKVTYVIRRLTPVECERLQGFPDDWTKYGADGAVVADTARYRAVGNSICVYCAERVYRGILDALEETGETGD